MSTPSSHSLGISTYAGVDEVPDQFVYDGLSVHFGHDPHRHCMLCHQPFRDIPPSYREEIRVGLNCALCPDCTTTLSVYTLHPLRVMYTPDDGPMQSRKLWAYPMDPRADYSDGDTRPTFTENPDRLASFTPLPDSDMATLVAAYMGNHLQSLNTLESHPITESMAGSLSSIVQSAIGHRPHDILPRFDSEALPQIHHLKPELPDVWAYGSDIYTLESAEELAATLSSEADSGEQAGFDTFGD